jgi:hypothetical protein
MIHPGNGSRGTAMVIVLGLLAIMSLLLLVNARTLYVLKGEIRLVEKQQVQHWTVHPAKK